MSRVGVLKEYPINSFYYAEISKISSKKMVTFSTLLLKIGDSFVDLCNPNRKIVTGTSFLDDGYRIQWKHLLEDYYIILEKFPSIRVIYVLFFFLKNKGYLEEQSEYFKASEIRLEEENSFISSRV